MMEGHGDDIYSYDTELKYNFSSNCFFYTDHSLLKKQLMDNFNCINNYPEPTYNELISIISEKYDISSEKITVTNGATEAIYLIAHFLRNNNLLNS